MPVRQTGDFTLNGKPYLLAQVQGARSWHRTGQPNTPSRRSQDDVQYGELPSEIEHVEVWDDWSGGFGYAYREPEHPDTYHWGQDMDARFPRQMVHCQALFNLTDSPISLSASTHNIANVLEVRYLVPTADQGRVGAGAILTYGINRHGWVTPDRTSSEWLGAAEPGSVSYLHRSAVFGSFVFLPVANATQFTRLNFAGGVVNADNHGMPGRAFAVAGNRLWRLHGPGTRSIYLQSCAAGADTTVTANWSATIVFGNGMLDGSDLVALDDQLFIGAADGLYAGDTTGTFFNVLPEFQGQPHHDNARDLTIHNGAVIVPHLGGILRYEPASTEARVSEIGPQDTSNRGPVHGRIRAVRGYGRWLLGGLWTGSQSYLLAGHQPEQGGKYIWHTQQRLPHVAQVGRIHVDGITISSGGRYQLPNRIWCTTDASIEITGTAPVYFFPIPQAHGNPLNPDIIFTPNYNGSARLDLGRTNWGAPATPKQYRAVEVWADNLLSGNRYADVYYEIDDLPRTLLGRAQTSPRSVLYFSAGANASLFTGQAIALSLESFTASVSETPVYRAIVLRGAVRGRSADLITAQVRVADNLRDRQQQPMRAGAVMLQELRDLSKQTAPVQLIDLTGAVHWVNVLPPIEEQEVWQKGDEYPEVVPAVRMAVLEYS